MSQNGNAHVGPDVLVWAAGHKPGLEWILTRQLGTFGYAEIVLPS